MGARSYRFFGRYVQLAAAEYLPGFDSGKAYWLSLQFWEQKGLGPNDGGAGQLKGHGSP